MSDQKNASRGGSQDSIDSLDEILDYYCWTLDLTKEENRYRIADIKEVILAWHNTQLKAAIPEFINVSKYDPDCPPTDLYYAHGYNTAIDLMQANLEKP